MNIEKENKIDVLFNMIEEYEKLKFYEFILKMKMKNKIFNFLLEYHNILNL